MKKITSLVILLAVVLLAGAGCKFNFGFNTSTNNEAASQPTAGNQNTETGAENNQDTTVESNGEENSGSYQTYSSEKLALAKTGKVVLFFKAKWCPTCRVADTDIKSNAEEIPDGVTILEVDYDNSDELKKKYGVTYQHTFVQVDENGNLITKWSGSLSLNQILSNIK